MTPNVRALHQLADQIADGCDAQLREVSDWLEGVSYGAPVSHPPSVPDLETYVRHLREACYRLHAALEAEAAAP